MRLQKWLPLGVVVVLVGCGGGDSSSSGGSGGADPATAIPAGVPVYIEAVVRPEGEQAENASALLERFMGEQTLMELLDEQLAKEGQSYAEDIEPWLGARAGIGVSDLVADEPSFVAAVAVTDAEAAEAAITESEDTREAGTYADAAVYETDDSFGAVTDDFLLIAETRDRLEAAIDGLGEESLADDERFTDAVGDLPEERLGAFYLDTGAFGEAIAADETLDEAGRGILEQILPADAPPVTGALTAEADGATLESRLPTDSLSAFGPLATNGEAPELVADAPAGTWGVFGAKGVGEQLETTLDTFAGALGGAAFSGQLEAQTGLNLERDVFSWIGDLSVWVRGETLQSLDGAVVIEVTDEDAAAAAIPRIIGAARKSGAPVEEAQIDGADQAFTVPIPEAPGPLVMAFDGERVVFSIGEQAAADGLNPTETIADSGLYERAEGAVDGIAPSLVLDFATIFALAEATGATSDPDYAEAKPYLDALDLFVIGSEEDGDSLRQLFSVTVKE